MSDVPPPSKGQLEQVLSYLRACEEMAASAPDGTAKLGKFAIRECIALLSATHEPPPECPECEGSGESAVNHHDGTQSSTSDPPCHVCGGSGRASQPPCPSHAHPSCPLCNPRKTVPELNRAAPCALPCDHDPMSHSSTLECDLRGALICKHCDEFDRSRARPTQPPCDEPDGYIRWVSWNSGGDDPEQRFEYEFRSREELHEGEGWVPLYSKTSQPLGADAANAARWRFICQQPRDAMDDPDHPWSLMWSKLMEAEVGAAEMADIVDKTMVCSTATKGEG